MKKILSLALAVVCSTALFAQVMGSSGIKNTLSTGFGNGAGYHAQWDEGNSGDGAYFYGVKDTFQMRYDISKFTVEGMLSWGMLYHPGDNNYLSFDYLGSYINFFASPLAGLDIGAGTNLNWKVGEAPSSAASWVNSNHVNQGGLQDGNPGGVDVAGKAFYANRYSSNMYDIDAALGVRYAFKDLFQVGLTIPSGTNTNSFSFNAAFEINPIDMLSLSIAYEGIARSNGNLYVGASLYFKNLSFDLYFAGNFRDKINGDNNDRVGYGLAATISIPSIHMTIRPELGFTDYMYTDYTFAWYIGNRLDITFADRFTAGLWFSYAGGAKNKNWNDDKTGGSILVISPDLSFRINNRHSLDLMFAYDNMKSYNNVATDNWNVDISWTYRY